MNVSYLDLFESIDSIRKFLNLVSKGFFLRVEDKDFVNSVMKNLLTSFDNCAFCIHRRIYGNWLEKGDNFRTIPLEYEFGFYLLVVKNSILLTEMKIKSHSNFNAHLNYIVEHVVFSLKFLNATTARLCKSLKPDFSLF